MPHRRRLHNLAPPLPPPPPSPHTAFDLSEAESRLPLLADYGRLKPIDDAPAAVAPPSAHWSAGSAFTGTEPATTSTSTAATGSSLAPASSAARDDTWVRRSREGYYMQLSLAIRITSEAFLAGVPPELLLRRLGSGDAAAEQHADVPADAAAVSYRLWVNGCLSWGDKIAHGFYNIMGIDPHLWAMCNADEGEGRRLPTLAALREVDASDQSSLEVVLVDKYGDSVLVDLERRALDLYRALGATLDLVRRLALLVSDHMG